MMAGQIHLLAVEIYVRGSDDRSASSVELFERCLIDIHVLGIQCQLHQSIVKLRKLLCKVPVILMLALPGAF